MSRRRRTALIVLVIVVCLLAAGVVYARPLLLTGTGYAAHNACAVALLADRGADAAAADLPDNPLVPLLRTRVDADGARATSSVLGLFSQTAWYQPGLGCTLAEAPVAAEVPDPIEPREHSAAGIPDDVDRDALEAALDVAFAEDDPQGRTVGTRAVVVVRDGVVLAERYADGFDADTPQLGWSMAKSVTNAVVGRLVAEGRLDVEDDALLDVWADDDRADITVDDLLRMASGLQWDEAYSLGSTITAMLYLEPDMGAFAAAQPLASAPGSRQSYSSGTTNVLCDVLARHHDGPASTMVHDLVLGPAGMASAVLEPDAAGDPVCSSYLWATPRDWARFGAWFAAEDGGLLPAGWIDYSTRIDGDVPTDDPGHAAHWWVDADGSLGLPDDAFHASGHDGQRLFVIPSAGLVVVRMGFTPDIPSAELGYGDWVPAVVDAAGR